MCQEMFFYNFGDGNLAAGQRLKYATYRDSWSERSFPRSATAIHSVSVNRTHNLPIVRGTLPLNYRRPSEIFVANT